MGDANNPPASAARPGGDTTAVFKVTYASLDELVVAYTEDVSRGGVFLKTTSFLPVGTPVRIKLCLPNQQEVIAPAKVAYVLDEATAAAKGRRPGMGMQFVDDGSSPVAVQIAQHLAAETARLDAQGMNEAATILVIDDNEQFRKEASAVMKAAGHRVIEANNGVEGLGRALQAMPDLILTDVQMPTMDGWQLLRIIRARPSLANTPVIFVTTLSSDEERLFGYRLGVDDYIAKPYSAEELTARVTRVLQRVRHSLRGAGGEEALHGDIAHVPLTSLLGFLEMEKRTGLVLLMRSQEMATLYLRNGQLVKIELSSEKRSLSPRARIDYVLDWSSGQFEFTETDVADKDEVQLPIASLLLDHARRQDESTRDRIKTPR